MLDQLIQFGKEQLGGKLQEVAGLKPAQVDTTMDAAKDSISSTLLSQATSGNLSGILDLFNGKTQANASNPIVSAMISNFSGTIAEKLNLPPQTVSTVANLVIPFLMQRFGSKETGTASDGNQLLSMLGIDQNNAIMGAVKGVLGDKADDLLGGIGKLFG